MRIRRTSLINRIKKILPSHRVRKKRKDEKPPEQQQKKKKKDQGIDYYA